MPAHVFRERFIQLARLILQYALDHFYARSAQLLDAFSIDERIWIAHGRDHAFYSGGDNCLCAGAGTSLVAAGLQVQIESRLFQRSALVPGLLKRNHLSMLDAFVGVKSAAQDSSIGVNDKSTNVWIRRGQPYALARQFERLAHKAVMSFFVVQIGRSSFTGEE